MLRVSSVCNNDRCVIHGRDSLGFISSVDTLFVGKMENLVRHRAEWVDI